MTNYSNAERLRREHDKHNTLEHNYKFINICRARPSWDGCDYCDVYGGSGLECWKQGSAHNCVKCERKKV
jgi:hypothetical protein